MRLRHNLSLFAAACVAAAAWTACGGGDDTTPPRAAVVATAVSEGLLAPVLINQPAVRETVRVPFPVSGAADVPGGQVTVQVMGADGAVLCERNVLTTGGGGTPSNWTLTFAFPLPQDANAAFVATLRAFATSEGFTDPRRVALRQVAVSPEPPPLSIVSPACGAKLRQGVPFNVAGSSRGTTGVLTVELREADGGLLAASEIAAIAGGTESAWNAQMDIAGVPPGEYDLVALERVAGTARNEFAIPVEVIP